MLVSLPETKLPSPSTKPSNAGDGCAWWNFVCQGGEQVADSSLSALTGSMVDGLASLFGQITKIVDESTRVPLGDPTYRDTYAGFVVLAVPVIALVYLIALLSAGLRRDPRALTRATVGIAVSAIGGTVYVVFAQLLVALDDWLAHGIVKATGSDFHAQMTELAGRFETMGGVAGGLAADFLMLILMFCALLAGVVLWIVLLLRKMAILVVVAFAPLLMAGWLWPPTRSWSRKATEVLVALVLSKSVIYMVFGIGMSLLLRDSQSLSDFVGVIVLLCGACFAPLVMLKLVHFAADSHLAGEMVGTLRAGAQPAINKIRGAHVPNGHRRQMANDYTSRGKARGGEATVSSSGPSQPGTNTPHAAPGGATEGTAQTADTSATGAAGGASSGASAAAPAAAAGVMVAKEGAQKTKQVTDRIGHVAADLHDASDADPPAPTSPGPTRPDQEE